MKNAFLVEKECHDFVAHRGAGGIAVFVGTVRDQTKGKNVVRLEFESYEPMAVKEMKKIAQTVKDQWQALKVSMHHRIGILGIGEIAVIIAVSTPHRKAAFEACEYAIDTLKETVPIWKKEVFEDGEVWVAAHP
ncbi:MAG: molybdenum cofactor biosynthesis protein MoaE [Bacteroidota bacterium]